MCQVNLNYVNNHMSQAELNAFSSKWIALGLYKEDNISLGNCADIAGMDILEFAKFLGENNVPVFRYNSLDEFYEELKNA